jgi:hypothetical protein
MRLTTKADPCIEEALKRLDTLERELTTYECDFLDSVMRGASWTDNQRRVLAHMCENWLGDVALAAEIRGQQRLF